MISHLVHNRYPQYLSVNDSIQKNFKPNCYRTLAPGPVLQSQDFPSLFNVVLLQHISPSEIF